MLLAYTFRVLQYCESVLKSICTFQRLTQSQVKGTGIYNLFIRASCSVRYYTHFLSILYYTHGTIIHMEQKIQALVSHDWSACYLRWRSDQIYGIFSFVRTSSKDFSLNRCVSVHLVNSKFSTVFPRPLDKVRGFTRETLIGVTATHFQ